VRGDDRRTVFRELIQPVDGELGEDDVASLPVRERIALLPLVDLPPPRAEVSSDDERNQRVEDAARVAEEREVGEAVLPDLRFVDVEVDDAGLRSEGGELAGDPVVEARADRDDQVAL